MIAVCVPALAQPRTGTALPRTTAIEEHAQFAPPAGRTLLIVGQDLDSVADYAAGCRQCPAPGGVTTYLSLYDLLTESKKAFGGLGENPRGESAGNGNWGAGASSARRSARDHPHSTLVLGLDISENEHPGGLAEIARGAHDDKIVRLAAFCRGLRKPVFLRIGYEFDGAWNRGYSNRPAYIAAWRRIVDVMRASGAGNVAFVWQASASPLDDIIEGGAHENIREWYPGADYVDWVALSWFLAAQAKPAAGRTIVPTQRELAEEVLQVARAEHKPVMIAESTPQGYDLGRHSRANISPLWDGAAGEHVVHQTASAIWMQWYEPLFAFIDANRDVIGAFAYINALWDEQPMWGLPYASGYWGDSRIQADPEIMKLWLAEITRPVWLHGNAALFDVLRARAPPPR